MRDPADITAAVTVRNQVRVPGCQRNPTTVTALLANLLMWIANVREVGVPLVLGVSGQRLRLAGYRKDITTRSADGVDDPIFPIAPQLGATGRSP